MDIDMAKEKQEKPMDVASMSALIEAQRKQIEKLEKDLKYSQDKNLALNTLIDVIEEQGIEANRRITRSRSVTRSTFSASCVSWMQ